MLDLRSGRVSFSTSRLGSSAQQFNSMVNKLAFRHLSNAVGIGKL